MSADTETASETTTKITALRLAGFRLTRIDPAEVAEIREDGYVSPLRVDSGHYLDDAPWFVEFKDVNGDDQAGQTPTWQRSTYRSIRRDYPETPFIDVAYNNVNCLGMFVDDLDDDLLAVFVRVGDGGIYDEDDWGKLDDEERYASVEQFAVADFRGELPEALADVWDTLTERERTDVFMYARAVVDYEPTHDGLEVHWDYEPLAPVVIAILESVAPAAEA